MALLGAPAVASWQRRYREVRLLTGRRRDHLHALWYDNFDEVRATLTDVRDPHQMFVRACTELQAGDPAAAAELAEHIKDKDSAILVLRNLIARRSERPDEAWLEALDHAWLTAYRPCLVGNRFANADLVSSHLDAWEGGVLEGTDHVLWSAMTVKHKISGAVYPRQVRNWAMAHDAAERDLAELIISNSIIAMETHSPDTPRMLVPIRDRLAELAPDNFWVRLASCVAHEGPSLNSLSIAALELCIDAPDVDASVGGAALHRFDEVAARAKVPYPIVAAQHASNLYTLLVPLAGLWARLAQTHSLVLSRRAANTLVALSRRMREDSRVFSAVAAYETLRQANVVLGSGRIADELEARRIEHDQLLKLADHMVLNPYTWPIPSLVDEAARAEREDELGFYRRYLGDPNAALPQAWLIERRV